MLDKHHIAIYGHRLTESLDESVSKVYILNLTRGEIREVYSELGQMSTLQSAGNGTWYGLVKRHANTDAPVESVIKSSDNGRTWETVYTFNDLTDMGTDSSLFFFSQNEGWLLDASNTRVTRDGGQSWRSHPPFLWSVTESCSPSMGNVWAIEENKLVAIDLKANERKIVLEKPPQNVLTGLVCGAEGNLWYAMYSRSLGRNETHTSLDPKIFKLDPATHQEELIADHFPDDFLPDQLVLSGHSLFVSGTRMESASFLGISKNLFKIALGKPASVDPIHLPSSVGHNRIGNHPTSDCLLYFQKDPSKHGYTIYSLKCGEERNP